MSNRVRTALLLLALFFAGWLPRVVALDRFVTIDERKWLARAANFDYALVHSDWANTFQREHPGVTVMWAGMAGLRQLFPDYAQVAPGLFAWDQEHMEAWLQQQPGRPSPLVLLTAGRWWIVLLVTLTVVLSYFPLRTLVGATTATWAVLTLAWSPFYIALSRQLHPDGLVASFTMLALLLFLAWLYGGQQWRYLIGAGFVMGLAWLTKTPAIFLVPTGFLLILYELWRPLRRTPAHGAPWRRLLTGYVLWGVIAVLTFVALWPAMWFDPIGTLLRINAEMGVYVERHTTTNYFWGQPMDDPGFWFYPVAYLFRTTPLTLVGLVSTAVLGWRRQQLFADPTTRRTAGALALFALILTLGMTIGAKKFDRYMLPGLLALEIVGLLGWLALLAPLVKTLWSRFSARPLPGARAMSGVTLGTLLLLHGLPGFLQAPYYLTYFNPLAGGALTAPYALFMGWGEGLEAAAQWLNQQPGAGKLRVAAWYADGPFSYYSQNRVVNIGDESPLFWLDTDYAVLYVNQWQRQLPSPEVIAYFAAQTPVHVVRFGGIELARVYDMRNLLLPDFVDIGKNSAADFGGQLRLLAYQVGQSQAQPGDRLQVTLYLQSLAPMPVNYNVLLRLVGQDGHEHWRDEGWPWGAPTKEWPIREIRPDGHTVLLPADLPAGLYRFELSFYDPATFDPLPVLRVNRDEALGTTAREVALLQVGAPITATTATPPTWQFGDHFGLDVTKPAAVLPATGQLTFQLQWTSLTRTAIDYTVFVHVVNGAGDNVAQQDGPPLGGFAPTRLWEPGQQLLDDYTIPLPADLPAGQYMVQVGLYTLTDGRLPVVQAGNVVGDFVEVGSVVAP
ncbi:MAG: glycosyltransferase family 39 protein [Caldilineaceae bacterium]